MYSRRFSNPDIQPPPDYGGVTYRHEDPLFGNGKIESLRKDPVLNNESGTGTSVGESDARTAQTEYDEENEDHEVKPSDDREDFAESARSSEHNDFSLEDLLLAGMLLMLIGDREEGKRNDGQLMLILGLLLLSK